MRRDLGRGLTPAQWARYCGRNLCADSIDKFVRTAVPDGEALLEEAGANAGALGADGGPGGPGGGRRRGKKNKDLFGIGNFLRSRSVGSSRRPSWLARKITKLTDKSNGDGGGSLGGHSSLKGSSSNPDSSASENNGRPAKLVPPRVRVTPAPEDATGSFAGGGLQNAEALLMSDADSSPGGSISGSSEKIPEKCASSSSASGKSGGKKKDGKKKKKKK